MTRFALRHLPALAPTWTPPDRRPEVLWATFGINVLSLALPLVVLQVYDRIIPHQAYSTLWLLIIGLGAVVAGDTLLRLARFHLTSWSGAQFEHLAGLATVERYLNSDLKAVEEKGAGEHVDAITSVDQVRDFYASPSASAIIDLPFVALFLGVLGLIAGWLMLVPLLLLGLFAAIAFWLGVRLHTALEARALWDDRRYNFIIEVLGGIHTIKGLAAERLMLRRYERLVEQGAQAGTRITYWNTMALGLGGIFSQLTMVVVLVCGAFITFAGDLSIGGLAAATLLAGRIVQPVVRVLGLWTRYQAIKVASERLAMAQSMPQPRDQRGTVEIDAVSELRLDRVSFAHAPTQQLALKDIDLRLEKGEIVGLKGANGEGKSTLLRLISGSLQPTSGEVRINGINALDIRLHSLRRAIAYVPQMPALFNGTVMDNIAMFRSEECLDKAYQLAEALGLDQVFGRLPDGYDTLVGAAASSSIPTGVAQRIMIARAFIMSPSLVLFDEATTGLDMEADRALRTFLASQAGKIAILLVTQRPSLLSIAARGYELKDGHLLDLTDTSAQWVGVRA